MFKKLLLVGAIITLVPLDREKQAELYQVARSTVADITGFCTRNPDVCEKGNRALDKLATKAGFGARMVVDIASDQGAPKTGIEKLLLRTGDRQTYTPSSKPTVIPSPAQSNERFPAYRDHQYNEMYGIGGNTLLPADKQADWRGMPNR